ncbi:unnamed protein product [Parnassius apollo]|uniref:(apollo) hypothetical protein n=1 Tax=Parnassius apollo TaxID=110799 RepID=A0A8S3XD09_PARAO|nr:unnamed protein product [Parnassius apollo]
MTGSVDVYSHTDSPKLPAKGDDIRALTTGRVRMRQCQPGSVLEPFHLPLVGPMIQKASSDHSGRDDSG